jgi:hypothetical protein
MTALAAMPERLKPYDSKMIEPRHWPDSELRYALIAAKLDRRSYCTKGHYHFGDRGVTIRPPADCRYCWRQDIPPPAVAAQ